MVSLRNQQLQAILWGVIIADALSHGQLSPVEASFLPPAANDEAKGSERAADRVSAIASNAWCQQLIADLGNPQPWPARHPLTSPLPPTTNVGELLAMMPSALLTLETKQVSSSDISTIQNDDRAATRLFYHAILASFRHDFLTLRALHDQAIAIAQISAHPLLHTLVWAFNYTLNVHGDYTLAVGQSRQMTVPLAGLPLLTGTLSASWVGLAGIPWRYRQAIAAPSAGLQAWLTARWQLSPPMTIAQLVHPCWQRWIGQDPQSKPEHWLLAVNVSRLS